MSAWSLPKWLGGGGGNDGGAGGDDSNGGGNGGDGGNGGGGGNGGDGGNGGNGDGWWANDAGGGGNDGGRGDAAAHGGWVAHQSGGRDGFKQSHGDADAKENKKGAKDAGGRGNSSGWGGAAAHGGWNADAKASAAKTIHAKPMGEGENKKEANDPWEGYWKKSPVELSEDTVNREYTWFVDFRDTGKNYWLEFSEEHVAILEEASASGQDSVELEHTYFTRKGKQKTTKYTINLVENIQISGDNGSERRIRRLRSAATGDA